MEAHEIRTLLEEAVQAASAGDRDYFAEGTLAPAGWIQVTWDAVNLSYASERDPAEILAELNVPKHLEISSWQPSLYVTFAHDAKDLESTAEFVASFLSALASDKSEPSS